MFSVVFRQCTEAMKSKLKSKVVFEVISKEGDVIKLLKLILNVAFKYES